MFGRLVIDFEIEMKIIPTCGRCFCLVSFFMLIFKLWAFSHSVGNIGIRNFYNSYSYISNLFLYSPNFWSIGWKLIHGGWSKVSRKGCIRMKCHPTDYFSTNWPEIWHGALLGKYTLNALLHLLNLSNRFYDILN